MNPLVKKVLDVARGEVGVREVNSNRGKRVEEYQRADLLPGVGYAWCASFCGWSILQGAGKELCDKVWLRSASCDAILDWARRREIISAIPQAGCAGLVMASRNDATHIFLVSEVLSSAVRTIEGNTNLSGSREGIGVFARQRPFASRYLYVHWSRLLPAADEKTYALYLNNRKMDDLPLFDGRAYCPAWKWAHWMNAALGWNVESQTVTLGGREVLAQPRLIENRAFLPIRALAEFSDVRLMVDNANRVVVVTRKESQ
jgi:hypothetical protein